MSKYISRCLCWSAGLLPCIAGLFLSQSVSLRRVCAFDGVNNRKISHCVGHNKRN